MNLYLSSYMLGDHRDHLLSISGGAGSKVAIITNALDAMPLDIRPGHIKTKYDPLAYFSQNQFNPSLVDLRLYFGRPTDLGAMLGQYSVIWALGGNSFLLRRAMRDSGFDMIIGELLERGIIYGGWSAGACVAGDRMDAVAIMDEPDATAPGYVTTDPLRAGMGLVPFTVIPHYDSDHFEAPLAEKAVAWAKARSIEHVALRDGEVIVMNKDVVRVLPKLKK